MGETEMSVREARKILNITTDKLTDRAIKLAYRRQALRCHPDMGGSDADFITIGDAKNVLLERTHELEPEATWFAGAWGGHLKAYIRIDQVVKALLARLTSAQISAVWMLSTEADSAEVIGEDIISEFRKQIAEMSEVRTIRPSIASALARLVHPLKVEDETFYVPLWHSRVEFDFKGRILIVNIDPVMPPHITVDGNNVIHVDISHEAGALIRRGHLDVPVGDRSFRLPASSVRMVERQSVSLGRVGLPCTDRSDPLDVSTTMEIVVHLILSLD